MTQSHYKALGDLGQNRYNVVINIGLVGHGAVK